MSTARWPIACRGWDRAEHWNGRGWKVLASPGPRSGDFSAVSAVSPASIWAVGSYADGAVTKALIAHWDGSRWRQAGTPPLSGKSTILTGVQAASNRDVWAVGIAQDRALFLHWNGNRWGRVGYPGPGISSGLDAVGACGSNRSQLRPGVPDDVPLAGDVLDQALALQDLQGPGRDAVGDLVVLGDCMHRGDAAGHGPLGDLVSQHLGYLLIRWHRRVRVDHRGQHACCAGHWQAQPGFRLPLAVPLGPPRGSGRWARRAVVLSTPGADGQWPVAAEPANVV